MSALEVLVTGARGRTGREVVSQLSARGIPVRAGSRTPEAATGAVSAVRFDWHEPATWPEAVAGVSAIYLARPDREDAPTRVAELTALAPDAHVVLLSEQGAGTLTETSWERCTELAVTNQHGTWTVLRPSWFHQVLTDRRYYVDFIREAGVLALPTGGARIAFVDTLDVAAVAVAAMLDRGVSVGATYEITGPEALTLAEVADLVAASAGRRVEAQDPPIEEAVAGLPRWFAELERDMLRRVRDGVFGVVTSDVERVTGKAPIAMATFAQQNARSWVSRAG